MKKGWRFDIILPLCAPPGSRVHFRIQTHLQRALVQWSYKFDQKRIKQVHSWSSMLCRCYLSNWFYFDLIIFEGGVAFWNLTQFTAPRAPLWAPEIEFLIRFTIPKHIGTMMTYTKFDQNQMKTVRGVVKC